MPYNIYIEDVPKHVGPNLVFADDDQQRSRPGRLAKHPAFGLLLSPAGYLTPPVILVTDGQTSGQTDDEPPVVFVTDGLTDGRTN